jgi:ketopantoate reductase
LKIAVSRAGGIGGFLGGALAKSGEDVSLSLEGVIFKPSAIE